MGTNGVSASGRPHPTTSAATPQKDSTNHFLLSFFVIWSCVTRFILFSPERKNLIQMLPSGRVFTVSFPFSPPLSSFHISDLETEAIRLTLFHFSHLLTRDHLYHFFTDNQVAGYILTKGISRSFFLTSRVLQIFQFLHFHHIDLLLFYLPSRLNPADSLSRNRPFSQEDFCNSLILRNAFPPVDSFLFGPTCAS